MTKEEATKGFQGNGKAITKSGGKRARKYSRSVRELDGIAAFLDKFTSEFKWLNHNDVTGVQVNHVLHAEESVLATSDHVAILHNTNDVHVPYARTPGRLFLTSYRLLFWPAPCTCKPNEQGHESWCTTFGPASANGIPFQSWPTNFDAVDSVFRRDRKPVIVQVPLLCIARLEVVNEQTIVLFCKDVRRVLIHFNTPKECDGFQALLEGLAFHEKHQASFAHLAAKLRVTEGDSDTASGDGTNSGTECSRYSLIQEYIRLKMLPGNNDDPTLFPKLRLLEQSNDFEWCSTYPNEILIPADVDDTTLRACSNYRSRGRIPAATWMHPETKAILARCAQPLSGFRNLRCEEDETVVSLLMSCSNNLKVISTPRINLYSPSTRHRPSPTLMTRSLSETSGGEASITQNFTGVVTGMLSSINSWAGGRNTSDESEVDCGRNGQLESQGRIPSNETINTQHNGDDDTEDDDTECEVKGGDDRNTNPDELQEVQQTTVVSSDNVEHGTRAGDVEYSTMSNEYYIIDARSQMAAMGNRALGKGTENPVNYPNATMVFMNIENIHAVRNCYQKVVEYCTKQSDSERDLGNFYIAQANWLGQVRSVLKASMEMAFMLHDEARSVLTHCSDGWDRTSQMVSLTQILLDPYYRTMKGFGILIEKEWLAFGHKFLERCDMLGWPRHGDQQEVSPIFVLWVDAVWQVLIQFPSEFEFTSKYLIAILDQLYSGRFDTFLHNSELQRCRLNGSSANSLWADTTNLDKFRNKAFKPFEDQAQHSSSSQQGSIIRPCIHFKVLKFWSGYFLRWDPISTPPYLAESYF